MDATVKVGGSLAEEPLKLKALCSELAILAESHRISIVPGGGKFADVVREFDRIFGLSDTIAHKMAILAMDQFGLFLSQITPRSGISYTLQGLKKISEAGFPAILLPSRLMFREDPLAHSWDVTSDSIAAYIASKLNARKVILVTDVDGIFTNDPKTDPTAKLISQISAAELSSWNMRTSVDRFLPRLLAKIGVDCYVVDGKRPERIKTILEDERAVCTRIVS